MKHFKLVIMMIMILFSLLSCNSDDYEIMNNFAMANNINVTNLQEKAFCFKDLYLTNSEEKSLNITISKDKCYNNQDIAMKKINFNTKNRNSSIKTKISFPLYSNDKQFIYIVIQTYDANSINFIKTEILYKLSKIEEKWTIVDSYKIVTQS